MTEIEKYRELAAVIDEQVFCGRVPRDADLRATVDAITALCDRLEAAERALRVIAEQDPVEMALDPQWAQRIARNALSQTSKEGA